MTKKALAIFTSIILILLYGLSIPAFADIERGEAQLLKDDSDFKYELVIDDNKEGLAQIDAYFNRKSFRSGNVSQTSSGAAGAAVTKVSARPDETNYQDTTWYYSTDNASVVGNHGTYSYYVSTTVDDALFGYYWYDSNHTSVNIVVICPTASSSDRIYITGLKGSLGFIATNFTYSQTAEAYVSSTNLTNGSDLILADSSIVDGLAIHDSYAAAVSALVSYDPTPRYGINYLLQPGHVAYIPINGTYSFNFQGYFQKYSKMNYGRFLGDDLPPWPYDNRTYVAVAGLPESNALPDEEYRTYINWQIYGKPNVLGQTKEGIASTGDQTYDGVGYLCVINPTYDDDSNYNGNILITGVTFGQIIDYPLLSILDPSTGVSTTISDTSDPYIADVDHAGMITATNSNGEEPDAGGGNAPPSAEDLPHTQEEIAEQTNEILNGIGGKITDLFAKPVEAIGNIVSAATGFFAVVASLWAWLPPDISLMINSALIVCVTLAVIKILWK